jgi:hypothetical protein
VTDARERAREFVVFCDGAEEAGFADYARRGRSVARDCLDALDMLDAERSARRAIQGRAVRFEELFLAQGSEIARLRAEGS